VESAVSFSDGTSCGSPARTKSLRRLAPFGRTQTRRRRRRHQPSRPPQAKIKPGSPAPAMGPGTGVGVQSYSTRRSTSPADSAPPLPPKSDIPTGSVPVPSKKLRVHGQIRIAVWKLLHQLQPRPGTAGGALASKLPSWRRRERLSRTFHRSSTKPHANVTITINRTVSMFMYALLELLSLSSLVDVSGPSFPPTEQGAHSYQRSAPARP
jgi:hypothetical protein